MTFIKLVSKKLFSKGEAILRASFYQKSLPPFGIRKLSSANMGRYMKLGIDVYPLDPDQKSITRLNEQLGMKGQAKVGSLQSIPFGRECSGLWWSLTIGAAIHSPPANHR
jgi:hypothetical protein